MLPGDVINAEIHVKYIDDEDKANWTPALQSLIASIINGTAAVETFFEGSPVPPGHEFPYPDVIDKSSDVSVVKAYLNYIVFDKDRNLIEDKSGYVPLTGGKENGDNEVGGHQKLEKRNIQIDEPGFVYIYLSNENPVPYDVFFDDFKVEHIQSPIVQADDYYPYGLSFNSYKRENRIGNKFLFNGVELDSQTKNYETSFRGYDPSLGRFMQIDPLADIIPGISTYHFGYNNPIKYADPLGLIGEQDMWGRDKFDENGAFIPSIDRPGGPLCSGCGDQSKGRWAAVETPVFTLDYSTHVDTDGNGSYDYNNYSYTVSSETNYRWVFDDFNKYSSPAQNGGVRHAGSFSDVSLGLWSIGSYASSMYEEVRALSIAAHNLDYAKELQSIRKFNKGYKVARQAALVKNIVNNAKMLEGIKVGARRMAGVGLVFGIADMANNDFSTESVGWFAADAIMTGVGLTGWGAPVAGIYFAGRFAYGLYELSTKGEK